MWSSRPKSWSRGASRTKNIISLGLGLETQSLGLGLDKKVENFQDFFGFD